LRRVESGAADEAEPLHQAVFENGHEMLSAGEEIHRYSNILRGVVKLSKLLADGRQQIVGLQFAPDFMGRLFREHSDVIADAATDVTVCSFPKRCSKT
jgi:CRP/FNR family transcriptional regulator